MRGVVAPVPVASDLLRLTATYSLYLDDTLCSLDNLTKSTGEYMSWSRVLEAVGVNLEVLVWHVRPPTMIFHMSVLNFYSP